MPIGPQLPPHLAGLASAPASASRSPSPSDDDDDDGDFGPALPPHLAAARAAGPSGPLGPGLGSRSPSPVRFSRGPAAARRSASPVRRAPGPARPPADDSDDEVIGPMPGAPEVRRSAADEFREREARVAALRAGASAAPVVKRDEWMMLPPTGGSLASLDPAKRPTAFARSSAAPAAVDVAWTETPAERAARLDDERRGVKRATSKRADAHAGEDEDAGERKRRKERERQIRDGVDAHNKSTRGASLLDQHAARRSADGRDDDEPTAIWDHDKMMGVTGRMLTDSERAQKIKDARGLNDRFGHGKAGAYSM
ncbi:hypothetical protein Q5752_004351 [Cryptotrichosporon argae]